MSREPQPTLEDEWQAWDPAVKAQDYWPGLGTEHHDGYAVDHGRLREIGGRLMGAFDEVYHRLHPPFEKGPEIIGWEAAIHTSFLVRNYEEVLCCFTGDVMMESSAAAALVGSSGQTYRFADQQPWRARPPLWNDLPSYFGAKGAYRVSAAYPVGSAGLFTPYENVVNPIKELIEYDRSHEDKDRGQIREMLMSWKVESLNDYAGATIRIANGLVEVAHALVSSAQDVRDAPWHGPAADKAQSAMHTIYENVRGLAAIHGRIAQTVYEIALVVSTAQHRFDAVVNKGGWEFSDLWGGDDDDARRFMSDVNHELAAAIGRVPDMYVMELPGLIPENERDTYTLAW